MTTARLIHAFIFEQRLLGLSAENVSKTFIWVDIVATAVQIGSGAFLSSEYNSRVFYRGQKVYVAAVGLGQLNILCLSTLLICFHRKVSQLPPRRSIQSGDDWRWMTLALLGAALMMTVGRVLAPILTYERPANQLLRLRHRRFVASSACSNSQPDTWRQIIWSDRRASS